MRAMSLKLIKGSIDQIAQNVSITYVMPRVLDTSQVKQMSERLSIWSKKAQDASLFVEDETVELFQ
jgi:26S proteasome regulatory subunit N9